ncbi:MAG: NUDIX domain-containing protein [Candidatus Omnitrophota bacterium]|nr:NUDIX domain-containing protein [Candidatus Omnitrophota bacterium]
MKKELDVVAALIKKDDKVFLCQRKEGDSFALLWEFPGGVVEENETFEEAIEREVKEELSLEVKVEKLLEVFEDENEELKITVYLFACFAAGGSLEAKDCNAFGLFCLEEIAALNLSPVDGKILMYLKNTAII